MPGVLLSVTIDDDKVERELRRLVERSVDMEPAFDEIGSMLTGSTQQRIQDEEDPEGNAWPELAESTKNAGVAFRKQKGKRRRIKTKTRGEDHMLRLKGHLFNSITHSATDAGVAVGTPMVYGALQQLGGTEGMDSPGAAANPGRPFLGISAEDEIEAGRILTDYLEGRL